MDRWLGTTRYTNRTLHGYAVLGSIYRTIEAYLSIEAYRTIEAYLSVEAWSSSSYCYYY